MTDSTDSIHHPSSISDTQAWSAKAARDAYSQPEPGSRKADRHSTRAGDTAQTPNNWTVVVDLTTNLNYFKDNHTVHYGAENQKQQILKLAEQTKNTGVSFYVQAKNPTLLIPDARSPGSYTGHSSTTLERYLIGNGQVQRLPDKPITGMANDLRSELADAAKLAPAKNYGLIMQSHGGGARGLGDGDDTLSLDQIQQSIKSGLGQNNSKLSFLDFDSCLMSSVDDIHSSAKLTRAIVGSVETESARGPKADGQNLAAGLAALLHNSNMTGEQLANRFVDLANEGKNDGPDPTGKNATGTRTLSAIDTSQEPTFNHALNSFGSALATALQNVNQNREVKSIIASLPALPATDSAAPSSSEQELLIKRIDNSMGAPFVDPAEQRDPIMLARGILADQGITDANVRGSAQALITAGQALVTRTHGETGTPHHYEQYSGITTFMPDQQLTAITQMSAAGNPLKNIILATSASSPLANYDASTAQDVGGLMREAADEIVLLQASSNGRTIGEAAETGYLHSHPEVQKIEDDAGKLAGATSAEDYKQALNQLHADASALTGSPLYAAITSSLTKLASARLNGYYKDAESASNPGWNAFLDALKEN